MGKKPIDIHLSCLSRTVQLSKKGTDFPQVSNFLSFHLIETFVSLIRGKLSFYDVLCFSLYQAVFDKFLKLSFPY